MGTKPTVQQMADVHDFITKDSGSRVDYPSGMRRDIQDDKPRYDLIPLMPLKRLAELYARGAQKYGESNWQLANTPEELQRFKASAWRHFVQYMNGETDEDHGIAAVWNIFAAIVLEEKLASKQRQERDEFMEVAAVVLGKDGRL
jgi:hypothetical protein